MAQKSVNCVFCFQTIDGEGRVSNDDRFGNCKENETETTVKFLKFLQRHLNTVIDHVNQESPASLVTGCDTSERASLDIHSCSDCNQLMSQFLDLYNQLKLTELKINWVLNGLVSVMSTATKVPSKVKAFNDSLKTSGDTGCSSDKEKKTLKAIHRFRKDFISKCNNHTGFSPRVTLDRHNSTSIKTIPLNMGTLLTITPTEEVVIKNEPDTDANSSPELWISDVHRYSDSCDEDESINLFEPLKIDRRNPIAITSKKANTSSSNVLNNTGSKRVNRVRKKLGCDNCSESFLSASALLSHQQTAHSNPIGMPDDEGDKISDNEYRGSASLKRKRQRISSESSDETDDTEKTEEEIIHHYANSQFKFARRSKTDRGIYLTVKTKTATAPINTDETADACIKTLSQCLSPAQQRLAAALLHQPKFQCKSSNCSEKFVFEDDLKSHFKLHGRFSCSLCSHREWYAPKLAEHVLTKHCTTISNTKTSGLFVSCAIPHCASLDPPIEFHESNYVFHYLTEHLSLDVSSIGCPICHYSNRGGLATHSHFQTFHGIFNMKPEDVHQCENCPAFFSAPGKLNKHLLAFHNKFPTSCPYCGKILEGKTVFKKHRRKCKGLNRDLFPHRCSFPNCNKKFANISGLAGHMQSCTFNPEGIWHDCSKCARNFRDEEQLERHLQYHRRHLNGSRKYKTKICEFCGKDVSTAKYQRHMRVHAGPSSWKHQCSECGKKCISAATLKGHMRTHKEASFVCQFCGAKYVHPNALRRHVKQKHEN